MSAVAASTNSGLSARRFITEYGLLIALVVMCVVFASLNPRFFTLANLTTLLKQNSPLFIVAVGMTFAIISRNIDLSPASVIALSGVALGLTFQATGSIWLGILAGAATAVGVELINALLIVRLGLNSLIVTLATWIWARGLAISLTTAESIPVRDPLTDFLSRSFFLEISPSIVLAALAFIVGAVILNRTRLGRYTFAMGSDERATQQAGVRVGKYKYLMFVLFGVCITFAMLSTVSRLGAAAPNAAYQLELDAIVAVIIGGNPFQGGEGSLRRTLIGALFISVLNNGLGNLGMLDAQIAVYKGGAILLILVLDALSSRVAQRRGMG